LIVAPLPAAGADEAGTTYEISGNGTVSCGAWTEGRKNRTTGDTIGRQAWVVGYLTAVNRWYLPKDRGVARDLAKGTDTDGLFAWIDNYCAVHPLDALAGATINRRGNASKPAELLTECLPMRHVGAEHG
jgi:hypothetical protein